MYVYIYRLYKMNLCVVLIFAWCFYIGIIFGLFVCRFLYIQFFGKLNKYIYYSVFLNKYKFFEIKCLYIKNGIIFVLKNLEYFNFVLVEMKFIFIDIFSVWSVQIILRFKNNNKVLYEVKNVFILVLYYLVKEEMILFIFIWRLKVFFYFGLYFRCILVCFLILFIFY